jgi:hypothetical protein
MEMRISVHPIYKKTNDHEKINITHFNDCRTGIIQDQ